MKNAQNVSVMKMILVTNAINIRFMKEYLLILLFGKTVILTPEPITLNDENLIFSEEKLDVLTSGANLSIDITHFLESKNIDIRNDFFVDDFKEIEKILPSGTFSVEISNESTSYKLNRKGYSYKENEIKLIFYNSSLPEGFKFHSLEIATKVQLENVLIFWQNYSK